MAAAAIREMYRQTGPYRMDENGMLQRGVLIRHLILPGQDLNAMDVMDFAAEEFPEGSVLFSLMSQYTPMPGLERFPELMRRVTPEENRALIHYMQVRRLDGFWKEPDADLWARTSDGVWCGAATMSPLAWVFRYWISLPDKAPHPDAAFAPNGGIAIAPGESYDPRGEMWYVAGYGTGGADGWRRFLDSLAR